MVIWTLCGGDVFFFSFSVFSYHGLTAIRWICIKHNICFNEINAKQNGDETDAVRDCTQKLDQIKWKKLPVLR